MVFKSLNTVLQFKFNNLFDTFHKFCSGVKRNVFKGYKQITASSKKWNYAIFEQLQNVEYACQVARHKYYSQLVLSFTVLMETIEKPFYQYQLNNYIQEFHK